MRVLIVGNCHAGRIKDLMDVMLKGVVVDVVQYRGKDSLVNKGGAGDYDVVVVMSTFHDEVSDFFVSSDFQVEVQSFPHLNSYDYHPDVVNVKLLSGERLSLLGSPSHSLICLYGWLNKIRSSDVLSYYNDDNYQELGFFSSREKTVNYLKRQERLTGYDILKHEERWRRKGCWMYSPNHPKTYVYAEMVLQFAEKNGVEVIYRGCPDFLYDRAASGVIWPVYGSVGDGCSSVFDGVDGLKIPDKFSGEKNAICSWSKVIEEAYRLYDLNSENIDFSSVAKRLSGKVLQGGGEASINPYKNLPDIKFWRRAVAGVDFSDVDPVAKSKFVIEESDMIATAGSCFAQHVSRRLVGAGFKWINAEPAPNDFSAQQASLRSYNVYSARYGNIYTSTQLVQLFQRAFGLEDFNFEPWVDGGGHLIDPFRPYVEPDGFGTRSDYEEDYNRHLSAVKKVFESLDVFVFTLGLTECWVRVQDSAVIPFHPGVLNVKCLPGDYVFKNLGVDDVVADLLLFKRLLNGVNPEAKIVITVSPVPLIATYAEGHVLTQTTYSKSVLRVAAENFSAAFDDVAYFPSYEIISSHYNRGAYYAEDLREVEASGVDHVMRLMLEYYTVKCDVSDDGDEDVRIVCDEENLD